MGGSQSGHSRTVSMENDTPVGVIDVSDAVVQRLRSGLAKGDATKSADKPTKSDVTPSSPTPPPSSNPSSYPNPTPYPHHVMYGEPTITAIEVRRQKEAELAQNDLYWRKRMSQLEQTLNKTNSIMEKEYTAAVEDVRKRFQNASPIHQLPPCQDLKVQLIACYRAHPGESLKCADEVNAFTNCVSENRVKRLDYEKSPSPPSHSTPTKAIK